MAEINPTLYIAALSSSHQLEIDVDAQKTPTKENQEIEIENKNNKKPKETKPKNSKPPNWRIEEDQSLCTSWLNTSKDPTVGNYQTKTTFWDRIYTLYLDLMAEAVEKKKNAKGFKPFPLCLKKPLEDQWYHIQHQVNKYCGYYSQVKQRMRSGSNNDDLVSHHFSYVHDF
jgi:hypothetical protein